MKLVRNRQFLMVVRNDQKKNFKHIKGNFKGGQHKTSWANLDEMCQEPRVLKLLTMPHVSCTNANEMCVFLKKK